MNRRDFLVKSGISLASGLLAINAAFPSTSFLFENVRRTDPESKWCYWMIENLTPVEALWCIKQYGFTLTKGNICNFFINFCDRQPETLKWLRRNIDTKDNDSEFGRMRRKPTSPGIAWYDAVTDKLDYAVIKFNLPIKFNAMRMKVCNRNLFSYNEHKEEL